MLASSAPSATTLILAQKTQCLLFFPPVQCWPILHRPLARYIDTCQKMVSTHAPCFGAKCIFCFETPLLLEALPLLRVDSDSIQLTPRISCRWWVKTLLSPWFHLFFTTHSHFDDPNSVFSPLNYFNSVDALSSSSRFTFPTGSINSSHRYGHTLDFIGRCLLLCPRETLVLIFTLQWRETSAQVRDAQTSHQPSVAIMGNEFH